ncbi:MAG TPA: phosphoribosylglycinamide formyltransferase [Burkholderiales bacterium]|nr:phosphoribosylglycinamide formyltransferase [Burkholderiales bacterium]
MKRIAILVSGRGSNMQAILDARLPVEIAAVVSNNPGAKALDLARAHGLPTATVNHREHPDRAAFDSALAEKLAGFRPDLVVLAGFMRILTEPFLARFGGRILNIHPSLLPAFPGTDTHRRALDAGVRLHGCTVHFVTPALDHGPIVIQAAVPVLPDDDEQKLAARVLEQEHRIYPLAVRWFAEGKLTIGGGRVRVDEQCVFPQPIISPAAGK